MTKFSSICIFSVVAILATACSQTTTSTLSGATLAGSSCSAPTTAGSGIVAGTNVLSVGVGTTSLCGGDINIPCTSVTVCVTNTGTCQTISDILVDTGSYGLRIFSQAVSLALTHVVDGSAHPIAECAQFGSATDWGPVMNADVYLGGETKVNTSIQVIDHTYGTGSLPAACSSAETSNTQAGINGILGVGLFTQDCGTNCTTVPGYSNLYFGCNGGTCSGTTVTLVKQVTNPVSLLSVDNNGVILDMPSVPVAGSSSVTGSLILGIDTEANNSSTGFTKYSANGNGFFSTSFGGHTYVDSFIDSGSNGYFFPNPGWSTCGSFYCTGSTSAQSATVTASSGNPSNPACFTVADANELFNTGNAALDDIAAPVGFSNSFDWGLPFFYGRKVFVGIQGTSSNLGAGPYWAY